MSEPTAAATPAAGAGSPIRRLIDRLAGYDFFVSYAQTQAREYADRLHAELQARGFRTFLDRQVYVAGDELNAATRRRVQASSKLVVVVDEPALRSYWVQQEIEVALDANRPIIAIDLLGDLSARAGQGRTAALLADRIHIREPMDGPNHGPASRPCRPWGAASRPRDATPYACAWPLPAPCSSRCWPVSPTGKRPWPTIVQNSTWDSVTGWSRWSRPAIARSTICASVSSGN